MKTNRFLSFETLKTSQSSGKTILLALLFIPLFILATEGLLRVASIPPSVLVPSIDRELNYPEIDIKLSRLSALETEKKVNCFLLGSSMVDFGIDPSFINRQPEILEIQNPVCFNMALKAMKPEIIARIADILVKQKKPALLIVGISPNDFTGGQFVIRKFVNSPWLRYYQGDLSAEGWWIENSKLYPYWLSFLKYRDPVYRGDMKDQLQLIDAYGSQKKQKNYSIYRVSLYLELPDFQFLQNDLDGFTHIASLNSPTLKVVVVEMPVHPDFLPYYVPEGEKGYEELFIQPVQKILEKEHIPFIRTQSQIRDVVTSDGWKDYLHLNEVGNMQFSQWLAEELSAYQ
jgi:hypothetical protein